MGWTLNIGQVESRASVQVADLEQAASYLIDRGAGWPMRWANGHELHTANNRGGRAFSIRFRDGNAEAALLADEQAALTLQLREHYQRERANLWSYRYTAEMGRTYRNAFAALKAGQMVMLSQERCHWQDLDEFRAEFMRALQRRINLKVGHAPPYRKLDSEYQRQLFADSRAVRDMKRGIRVYQLSTVEAQTRFGHLLAKYDD